MSVKLSKLEIDLLFSPQKKYKKIFSQFSLHKIINEKKKIIAYLNSFEPVLFTSAKVYDDISKTTVHELCDNVFFDGEYEWTAEEKYLFEKYDLKLDKDFIKHVLSKEQDD